MAFKSSTFKVSVTTSASPTRKKKLRTLRRRHKGAMDKVLADAKQLAEDRKRTLNEIAESQLRPRAAR